MPLAAIGNLRALLRGRELNTRMDEQMASGKVFLDAAKRLPNWRQLCVKSGMDPEMTTPRNVSHLRNIAAWIDLALAERNERGSFGSTPTAMVGCRPMRSNWTDIDDTAGVTFDRQLNAYLFAWSGRGPGAFSS